MIKSEVIHQNKSGEWYFWDETWSFEEGPYDTRENAEIARLEYCKTLEGE